MTNYKRSKAKRNLTKAANKTLSTVGNLSEKGGGKLLKWMAKDHSGLSDRTELTELQQSINFSFAKMELSNRRLQREFDRTEKLTKFGKITSLFEQVFYWCFDTFIFMLKMIWGFFEPILDALLTTIIRIVVVILFNAILFYVLFLIIFSD